MALLALAVRDVDFALLTGRAVAALEERGQRDNRAWVRRNSVALGQAEDMAILIQRTLLVTTAPIFSGLRRMVPQVATTS